MRVDWRFLGESLRGRFEELNEADRFACFLGLQCGSECGWGDEEAAAADCAGSVEVALFVATGLFVRMSADGLMRQIFTVRNPSKETIQAAFFVTRTNRGIGEALAKKGTATRVAGVVGRGVVLHFEQPRAAFRTTDELWDLCRLWDYDLVVRGLDRGALERAAAEERLLGPVAVGILAEAKEGAA